MALFFLSYEKVVSSVHMLNTNLLSFLVALLLVIVLGMYFAMQRMQDTYDSLLLQSGNNKCPQPVCPPCPVAQQQSIRLDPISTRDRAANSDPLYPPLNRMPRRDMNEDTFRFIGYLVNSEEKEDTWKLYGREKQRGQGDFYVTSANKNMDMKITITQEMTRGGQRLKDIWDIPDELSIKHPMFSSHNYQVVLNQNHDFSSNIYV